MPPSGMGVLLLGKVSQRERRAGSEHSEPSVQFGGGVGWGRGRGEVAHRTLDGQAGPTESGLGKGCSSHLPLVPAQPLRRPITLGSGPNASRTSLSLPLCKMIFCASGAAMSRYLRQSTGRFLPAHRKRSINAHFTAITHRWSFQCGKQ